MTRKHSHTTTYIMLLNILLRLAFLFTRQRYYAIIFALKCYIFLFLEISLSATIINKKSNRNRNTSNVRRANEIL
jgi:hypothetical protein